MILIVDNESRFIKGAYDLLDRLGVPYRRVSFDRPDEVRAAAGEVRGLILSGGPGNPEQRNDLEADHLALDICLVPTLGLCLGHQIIGVHFGGKLAACDGPQDTMEPISILDEADPIFAGLPRVVPLREKHHWCVDVVPPELRIIGSSKVGRAEVVRHVSRPVYGFQSHPEVSGDYGERILRNFLGMCGY